MRDSRTLAHLSDAALGGITLLALTGALVLATVWVKHPDPGQWKLVATISCAMIALAGGAALLPWRRLPPAAAVLFPLAALGGISAMSVLGQGLGAPYVGVWVLAFLHTGLFLPALAARGAAAVALALFGFAAGGWDTTVVLRAVIACAACLLVSEVISALLVRHRAALARLAALSERDALTGVHNRRGLAWRLELASSADVVIMCDLDHFKVVNDTFGHQHGDTVLQDFAAVLSSLVGPADTLARYGGEEFCILLTCETAQRAASSAPGTGVFARTAEQRAQHLLSEARRLWVLRQPSITFSSGRATIAEDSAAAAVLRADEALYAAKAAGRNRDVLAEAAPVPEPGDRVSRAATGRR